MACTATASRSVKKEIIDNLEMSGCVEVTVSLDRPNVYYEMKPLTDIDADFWPLVSSLREKLSMLLEYSVAGHELYAHFHHELQEASYYPQDPDHISDYRLFGMFHSSTCQHNKDVSLKSLQVPDGVVRVVFVRDGVVWPLSNYHP